jgi:hypothetical protein
MDPRTLASMLGLGAALCACESPMVGDWQSDNKLPNGERNTMSVDSDLTGKAAIWATPNADHNYWVRFKFKLKGEEKDDGFRFDFRLTCTDSGTGECIDRFDMDCKVYDGDENNGLDKANCKGSGSWVFYPFDWERHE